MRLRYVFSIALLCCGVIATPIIHAQEQKDGLRVSPLRSRPVQKPGDTTSGELTISNHSGRTLEVSLDVERFKVVDEAYNYDFAPGEYTDWIRLADRSISLEDKATKKVAYSLAVPNNAPPGGYYFALFASSKNGSGQTSFVEVQRIASLVYLEVSGLIERKATMLGVDVAWLQTKHDVPMGTRISNQGNSHSEARIKQTIRPLIGKSSDELHTGLVLPSTIRNIEKKIQLPWWPGIYRISSEFSPPQGGTQRVEHTVVYFPLWLLVVPVAILSYIAQRRLRHTYAKPTSTR